VSIQNTFTGHEQGTNASLVSNGVFYRCYVWKSNTTNQIEAQIYIEQEHGQDVAMRTSIVRIPVSGEIVDCPKILASGTRFVVHWVESDGTVGEIRLWQLHRSTIDMSAVNPTSWTHHGAVAIMPNALYDACPIIGETTDFIVARHSAVSQVSVTRYDGYDWVDTDWFSNETIEIADRVLAVYAHEDDNDVIISYQIANLEPDEYTLWSAHLDCDDGGSFTAAQTFLTFEPEDSIGPGLAEWAQVSHARVGPRMVIVSAEAQISIAMPLIASQNFMHWGVRRVIDSSDASVLWQEQSIANVNLCSLPFAYSGGRSSSGASPDVYQLVSFLGLIDPLAWSQGSFFVINLDFAHMQNAAAHTLRARPVATLNSLGIADARASGRGADALFNLLGSGPAKRMNHLSAVSDAPPFGPLIKSKTVAAGVYARMSSRHTTIISTGASTQDIVPTNAGIVGYHVIIEDPQTLYRDDSLPEWNNQNFHGSYPWGQYHSTESGRGLVVAGGTPHLFDGHALVELGFCWYPELYLYQVNGTTGQILPGSYFYVAVFEWRDGAGQLHRSAPSQPLQVDIEVEEGPASVILACRSLSLTLRQSAHYGVQGAINVALYRTRVFDPAEFNSNSATFYRVYGAESGDFSPESTPVNDPTQLLTFLNDDVVDAGLIYHGLFNNQLTSGGLGAPAGWSQINPEQPPASSIVCVWQNRVWLACGQDTTTIWYSREVLPRYGDIYYAAPEFNSVNTFRIDGVGEVTAMHPMNNALIVFTRDAIYSLTGSGNSDLGTGANLAIETLHEGTGCIEPRSVVLAPPGIYFQSRKGIYLLDRGRGLDFVSAGASVEDEIRGAGNVRGATLLEDRHQIRFSINGAPIVTQTTEFDVSGEATGIWQIIFNEQNVAAPFEGGPNDFASDVAEGLAAEIESLIPTLLLGVVASVSVLGSAFTVVFADGVHGQTFTLQDPGGGTLTAESTVEVEVAPQVLLYDYSVRLWSRLDLVPTSGATNLLSQVAASCAWRGLDGQIAHCVLSQGSLLIERAAGDPLEFADQNSVATLGIPIDIQTSWIHIAGIAGYKRTRSGGVQLEKPNVSSMHVSMDYDIDGEYDENNGLSETFDWASPAPAYLRVRPSIQKFSACRLRIHDDGDTITESVSVTSITFDVGVKKGLRRVADTQIGT
jgi:hypothetical protein